MAEKKSTYVLELEYKSDKANANIKKFNAELAQMDKRTKEAKAKMAQINLEMRKFASLKTELSSANQQMQNGLNGTAKASGAAAAATMELGRVVSDAPYGIRGMANNVSQLASQVFYMSKSVDQATGKTIGMMGALKGIGKQLMGSMGVLVAIQVVIAAVDYFANRVDKANKTLNELAGGGITDTYLKFKMLIDFTNDATISIDEKTKAVKKANEELEEYNLKLDEEGRLTQDSTEFLNAYTEELYKTAKAKAILSAMTDEMKKVVIAESKTAAESLGSWEKLYYKVQKFYSGSYGQLYETIAGDKARKKAIDEANETIKKLTDMLTGKGTNKEDGILFPYLFGKDTPKGSRARRMKAYKQALLDLSKFIIQQGKEEADIMIKNEREKINTKQRYEKEDLLNTKEQYLEKNKIRLNDFLKTVKTEKERLDALETFRKANLDAESEYQVALTALNEKQAAERFEFERLLRLEAEKLRLDSLVGEAKASEKLMKALRSGTSAGALNKPMSSVGAEDIGGQQEVQKRLNEAEEEQFYNELEQKKIRLLNAKHTLMEVEKIIASERNEFLMSQQEFEVNLERDKIEAKKNINLEYVSWISGLGDVFSSLSNQSKELAAIGLVLEKGAAIADIIIKTTAANQSITANTEEEVSGWMSKAAAAPLGTGAGFLAMATAAQAMGAKRITKNKIGAGISIAKIAATTLSSRGGAGGSTPQQGGGRTFDFNLVGSTGQQQLATAIGEQFQQPIQAYVVSSQITSQQQMDNVIQTQAEF